MTSDSFSCLVNNRRNGAAKPNFGYWLFSLSRVRVRVRVRVRGRFRGRFRARTRVSLRLKL